MKRLEELDRIAGRALGGLTAGPELKQRIASAAAEGRKVRRPRYVPVLAAAAALVLIAGGVLLWTNRAARPEIMVTMSAGDHPVNNERGSLNEGSGFTVGAAQRSGENLWSEGEGSFPMVGIGGRYYRMLEVDGSAVSGIGEAVATVDAFTREPSLSGRNVTMSNAVEAGGTLSEVEGMGGTLVAGTVGGQTRLFQRVSYNGSALQGGEGFADVLQVGGHIRSITLTGAGTVGGEEAEALFETLASTASYESSGSVSAEAYLVFELDNGASVQMAVHGDRLAACGVWSCPDFLDAFREAAK